MRQPGSMNPLSRSVIFGGIAVVVIVGAIVLAYNANSGLPLKTRYRLKVQFPNAVGLVPGNDVKIAASRIGRVAALKAKQNPDGSTVAIAELELDKSIKKLPRNSTFIIRTQSALGLKFVQIIPGQSTNIFPNDAVVPPVNATPRPVELDQVFSMFSPCTRFAARTNLRFFGDGLAGRGEALNAAIINFNPLLQNLTPVMRNFADPRIALAKTIVETGKTTKLVENAAVAFGSLFGNLAVTYSALASVAVPFIEEGLMEGPGTLDTEIVQLPLQVSFLHNVTALAQDLRPGTAALRTAALPLARAIIAGIPALRRLDELNVRLGNTFQAVQSFADDPVVPLGLNALNESVSTLNPILQFVAPAQTVCNYGTLWFRNVSSLLSEGDNNGTWQRFLIAISPMNTNPVTGTVTGEFGPNNEGTPSSGPANGPFVANHLHSNPYPNTAAPGQSQECEAGRERYQAGKTIIGNVAGSQGEKTERTKRVLK